MSRLLSRLIAHGAPCFVAGMLVAPTARVEPATDTRVVVLGDENAALTKRLRAELDALGFHVLVVPGGNVSPAELEAHARETGAAVALSATENSHGVELRLVDRVTDKTLLREVLQRDLSSTDPDTLLALRAVELLRASLLEIELVHPPRGEVAVTNTSRETIRRSRDQTERAEPPLSSSKTAANTFANSVLADAGIAVLTHPGETRLQSGVSAALSWQPTAKIAVGVWGTIPLDSVNVSASEGAADVRSHVFGSGLRILTRSPEEWLTPTFGAGASAIWLSVDGTRARPDLVLTSEELIAVGPYVELGCAWSAG